MVPTKGPGATWQWNELSNSPSISPSIDVKSGHFASNHVPGEPCWCGTNYGFNCYHCHSIVTNGQIIFCSDSSHALAGQTVDLPEITSPL